MRAQPLNENAIISSSKASVATPADTVGEGTSTPNGYTPAQIDDAYGINGITFGSVVGNGAGQTIAIITAYDNPDLVDTGTTTGAVPFDASDLYQFDQQFNLPDPPSFIKVNQTGGTSYPGDDPSGYWENESSLDVEWAHALAPQANIVLVEANDDTLDNLIGVAASYARTIPGVSVVSMSFSSSEAAQETGYDPDLVTPAGHAGVTFVAGSGDEGAPGGYPAYSPNVLAAGDTTLTLNSTANGYGSETGYSESGGGVSQYEAKPAYQDGVASLSSTSYRSIPDVAFSGDPSYGVPVYDAYNGGQSMPWYEVGGTSFAAPSWSALVAIADQGRASAGLSSLDGPSQTLPRLYALGTDDFHDITTGNNGYAAGPGYDLVTGLGTPVANLLVPALAGGTASISGSVFSDAADDGVRSVTDKYLSGWTVYLDVNGNGTFDAGGDPSTTTAANGTFTFSQLAAGTYTVRLVVPSGYTQTAPSSVSYTLAVQNGQAMTGALFGAAGTANPVVVMASASTGSASSNAPAAGTAAGTAAVATPAVDATQAPSTTAVAPPAAAPVVAAMAEPWQVSSAVASPAVSNFSDALASNRQWWLDWMDGLAVLQVLS